MGGRIGLRAAHVNLVAAVLGLGPVACLGEGSAAYKGTITHGSRADYYFSAQPNQRQLPAVADAAVSLYETNDHTQTCAHVDRTSSYHSGPDRTGYTDQQGRFSTGELVFGAMPGSDTYLLICVSHPDYSPYEYRATNDITSEPTQGEQFLNIVLAPKTPPPAAQRAR